MKEVKINQPWLSNFLSTKSGAWKAHRILLMLLSSLESPADLVRHLHVNTKLVAELEQESWVLLECATDHDRVEAIVDTVLCNLAFLDTAHSAD